MMIIGGLTQTLAAANLSVLGEDNENALHKLFSNKATQNVNDGERQFKAPSILLVKNIPSWQKGLVQKCL